MKSTAKRTERKLQRTQRRLKMLELERRDLLLQWSHLDRQLQSLQEVETERRLPLPPHLQTLEAYLQEKEQQQQRQQEALKRLSLSIRSPMALVPPEPSRMPSLSSIPPSLLSTSEPKSPTEPAP